MSNWYKNYELRDKRLKLLNVNESEWVRRTHWGKVLQTKNDNNHNRKNQWNEKSIIFFYRIAFCLLMLWFFEPGIFLHFFRFGLVFREIRKLNLNNDDYLGTTFTWSYWVVRGKADALTVKFNWLVHVIILMWFEQEKWTWWWWWALFHIERFFIASHWLHTITIEYFIDVHFCDFCIC